MAGKCIIVMGVCGSGKSSVGLKVAEALGAKFIDGDDLHPKANIQKMAGGNPLNDEDRAPGWSGSATPPTVSSRRTRPASLSVPPSKRSTATRSAKATSRSASSSSMAASR